MTKFDYLDTLKRALSGLPSHVIAATMSEYEWRFSDGMAAGRSEADIAQELETPSRIGAMLRASTQHAASREAKSPEPARFVRVFFSSLGLLVFNFFMVVPAIVYSALLFSFYVVALACYLGGIVSTASSLSGVSELNLKAPFEHIIVASKPGAGSDIDEDDEINISIADARIHVNHGPAASSPSDAASAAAVSMAAGKEDRKFVQIASGTSHALRSLQAVHGIGIILGGIALLLMSAVLTKYTWIGMKRYVQMNLALLQNA